MKKRKMLFPNCSEIIWRLNVPLNAKEKILKALEGESGEYCTSDTLTEDEIMEQMINMLSSYKEQGKNIKDITIEYVDCGGGGLEWETLEDIFEQAKRWLLAKR